MSIRHVLAFGIAILYNGLISGQPQTMTVGDPRPVAKAIEQIEGLYGVPVTYEDPPYLHSSETEEMTQARPSGNPWQHLIPRERSLSFVYSDLGQAFSEEDASTATLEAIRSVLMTSYGSRFGLLSAGRLHVIPKTLVNSAGHMEPYKALLNTPVSLAPKERTAADWLHDLATALFRATGQRLGLGAAPVGLLLEHKTNFLVSDMPAREALDRLLDEIGAPLSWQLFHDPQSNSFWLNIHHVNLPAEESTK